MSIRLDQIKAVYPEIPDKDCARSATIANLAFSALPHLQPPTTITAAGKSAGEPDARWLGADRRGVVVRIPIWYREGTRLRHEWVEGVVTRSNRTITTDDFGIMKTLVAQASRMGAAAALRADDDETILSQLMFEYVTSALARYFKDKYALQCNLHAVFMFLNKLAQSTYEGNRLSFGLAVTDGTAALVSFPEGIIDNKRYMRLSDGVTTVFKLNKQGFIEGLEELPRMMQIRRGPAPFLPRWLEPLGEYCRTNECLGVALTRNGDLHIVQSGRYRASKRAGKWIVWDHNENLNVLFGLVGASEGQKRIIRTLYRVALDLSARRSGGLLVWLTDDAGLAEITSDRDRIGSPNRSLADAALDETVQAVRVEDLSRPILVDLASLDGALIVSTHGRVLCFGAIVRLPVDVGAEILGARSRAAIASSRSGLAIKISSDGDIAVYHNGQSSPVVRA